MGFFVVGLIPANYAENEQKDSWVWRLWKYGLLLPLFYYAFTIFRMFGIRSAFRFMFFVGLLFTLSFLWDVIFIKTTRWMLRIASNTRQLVGVIIAIVLDTLLGVAIIVGPLVVAFYIVLKSNGSVIGVGLLLGSSLKLIDFTIAVLVLILFVIIGIHVIVWFVLERPIYNCLRFKVIREKRYVWFLAGALYAAPHIGLLEALLK